MAKYLKIMETACLKAGRYLKRDYGELENLQVSKKSPGNFVTSADLKAEKIVIETLQESYPNIPILSEESGKIEGNDTKLSFILDPIDRTTNFMHALPFFCVSLAMQEHKPNGETEIVAACIYAPILDELYLAEKDEGATCNGKRITVSGRDKIEGSCFAAYLAKYDLEQRESDLQALSCTKIHTRIYGSAALELAFVAAGKLEGMWHWRLRPWDIAAGILLVKEARGIVTEIDGGGNMMNTGSILATNSELYDKISGKIAKCYSGSK